MNYLVIYFARRFDSLFERTSDDDSIVYPIGVSCDNNVRSLRQRSAHIALDRFKGLATHDDGVTLGDRAEALEVVGDVPKQFVVFPQFAIPPDGNNGRNR